MLGLILMFRVISGRIRVKSATGYGVNVGIFSLKVGARDILCMWFYLLSLCINRLSGLHCFFVLSIS
ncbi:hypothetical protein HanRHA438_Chr01g0042421 [Helianthus annuus]|nr:hypothetical protein HanRHA438_Chr01g0042421 [Helianthus annuus]